MTLLTVRQSKAVSFIALAKTGNGSWQSVVLTILTVMISLAVAGALVGFTRGVSPVLFKVYWTEKAYNFFMMTFGSAAYFIGFLISAKYYMRRPFLTLFTTKGTLKIRRIISGASLWLVIRLVAFTVLTISSVIWYKGWPTTLIFKSPSSGSALTLALATISVIPFQAAAEEMLFRGWLTQMLGNRIKNIGVVIFLIAVTFALFHGWSNWLNFLSLFIMSIGLSAISLFDGRLELAIGAHTANNIFVILINLFLGGPTNATHSNINAIALIFNVLWVYLLMFYVIKNNKPCLLSFLLFSEKNIQRQGKPYK